MAPIQVFVFMDFGSLGEHAEILTNVCLLAVPRDQYLQPDNTDEPPDKLYHEFDKSGFNMDFFKDFDDFINRQQKPVCLVSHGGMDFDFQILKRELQNLNVSLTDDLLCADCLYSFFDIRKGKYEIIKDDSSSSNNNCSESNEQVVRDQYEMSDSQNFKQNKNEDNHHDEPIDHENHYSLIENECLYPSTSNVNGSCQTNDVTTVAHLDAKTSDCVAGNNQATEIQGGDPKEASRNDNLQQYNEKTPEKQIVGATGNPIENQTRKRKSNFPEPGNAKRMLYKDDEHKHIVFLGEAVRDRYYDGYSYLGPHGLGHLYREIVRVPAIEHHPAQNDVYMKFRISHKYGKTFLAWTDQKQLKFADVPERPITIRNYTIW